MLTLGLVFFTSCEKATTPTTREDELRDGRWKLSNVTLKIDPFIGNDTMIQVYDSVYKKCEKDNYIVFMTNRQATQNNHLEKCGAGEPDEIPFTWELYNNGEGINFWNANETFFGQNAVTAPFVSYTKGSFVIRYKELLPSGFDQKQRDTFTFTYYFNKF